jgi:transposase
MVEVLQWPAQSPDLSAIELLWNAMKAQLYRRAAPLTGRESIISNVFNIYTSYDTAALQKFVEGAQQRMRKALKAKGQIQT